MRASARERAHTGTLASRSVEKVKTTSPCDRLAAAFAGLGSPPAEKPCIAARLGLKLPPRLGCRPISRVSATGWLRSDPLNLAGHVPVKGVRY